MRIEPRRLVRAMGAWVLGALLAVGTLTGLGLAQDQGKEAAAPPPAAEPEAAPAPKAEAEVPPIETPTQGTTGESAVGSTASRESNIVWFLRSSGIFGGVIILMSVAMVALIIRLLMEYRLSEAVPARLVEQLEGLIKEKKFQEIYDVCKEDSSPLARLVRAGVANLPNGRSEAKEAMSATTEEYLIDMEGKVSYLALIGTLGPMLGLLGTVQGMISAFYNLATVKGVQVDPQTLAGNISLALVTTLEGLVVAVPALFFFAFFKNRITTLAIETSKVAERTLNAIWSAAKTSKATGAPSA